MVTRRSGKNTVPLGTTRPISLAGMMAPPRTRSSARPPSWPVITAVGLKSSEREPEQGPGCIGQHEGRVLLKRAQPARCRVFAPVKPARLRWRPRSESARSCRRPGRIGECLGLERLEIAAGKRAGGLHRDDPGRADKPANLRLPLLEQDRRHAHRSGRKDQ